VATTIFLLEKYLSDMCSQYLSTDPKTNFATPTLTPITLKSVYRPHNKVGHFNRFAACISPFPFGQFLQCIIWRDNPEEEIRTYTLDTVTYGTKSAAFLAIRAEQQLALDEETNIILTAKIVRQDLYVDD